MKLKCIIFVLCCLAFVSKIETAEKSMGPLGNIIVNSVYECRDKLKPKGSEFKIKINFRKRGDDKILDVELDSKMDVDDNLNYTIDLKRFENGGWKKLYNLNGKPCEDFNKYIKTLWEKTTAALEPKPMTSCPMPSGSYKLNGFHAETKDVELKSIFYGKLLVTISLIDKSKKTVFCAITEVDSQAPQ